MLSYDISVNKKPSSGNWFHCLHATSQGLHPMHRVVSVKDPLRWPRLSLAEAAACLSSDTASSPKAPPASDLSLLAAIHLEPVAGSWPPLHGRQVA